MSPEELRTALLYGERTPELWERIPKDAMVLALGSLKEHNKRATKGRYIRRFLIVAGFVAAYVHYRDPSSAFVLLFVIAAYEFAYGNAAKVRADLEDMQDRERLRERVDEYLTKTFPGYKPPNERFTLFHVSPYAHERLPVL